MTTTTLTVPDISCAHCKQSIEGALSGLPGVRSVEVEIEPKTVSLEFDESEIGLEQIVRAIEEVGYDVPGHS